MSTSERLDPPEQVSIRLSLIGPPKVHLPLGVSRPLERRDAAMVAMLILRGPMSRPELAKALWSDSDEAARGANLRQRLMKLRKHCGGHALIVGDATLGIAEGVVHDLDRLLDGAGSTADLPEGAILDGLDYARTGVLERWVDTLRDRWNAVRRRHFEDLIRSLRTEGRFAAAIEQATRWVLMEPLVERAHWTLAHLHYEIGDREGAQRALLRCQNSFRGQGRSPGQALRELEVLVDNMARVAPRPVDAVPLALICPPRTVGREAVVDRIEAAWRLNRVVLLEGEAGVGKSRVLRELCLPLRGRIYCALPSGMALEPFGSLGVILRLLVEAGEPALSQEVRGELARIVPGLGVPAAGPFMPGKMQAAGEALVRSAAAAGTTDIVVDGCQWADAATLETLLLIIDRCADAGPRWLLCGRRWDEQAAVTSWAHSRVGRSERLTVPPLNIAQVQDLVASLGLLGCAERGRRVWAHRLAEVSGGSPIQVLERLHAVYRAHGPAAFELENPPAEVDRLPASMGLLIDERLGSLSRQGLELARVAALAWPRLSVPLAARVLGHSSPVGIADAWSELERKGVFLQGQVGFVHEVIREHLYNGIPQAVAQTVHAEIARYAEELKLSDHEIAEHLHLAGLDEPAGKAFARAAQLARDRNRRSEERDLWDRSAASFDAAGHGDAAFDSRARAYDAATVTLPPSQVSERALELSRLARNDVQRLDAALALFEAAANRRDSSSALAASDDALRLAQSMAAPGMSLPAVGLRCLKAGMFRAIGLAMDGQDAAARAALDEARRACGDDVPEQWQLEIQQATGFVLAHAGQLDDAERAYSEAVELAERVDDLAVAVATNSWLAQVLARRGAHDKALVAGRRCEQAFVLLGEADGAPALVVQALVGMQLARTGSYMDGLARLREAQIRGLNAGLASFEVTCREYIARVHLFLGQPTEAASGLGPWPEPMDQGRVHHRLLELEILSAQGTSIHDELLALRRDAEQASLVEFAYWHLLCARAVSPAEAVETCDCVLDRLPATGLESLQIEALTLRAEAYATLGRVDLATASWTSAQQLSRHYRPLGMYIGEHVVRMARTLALCGEDGRAMQLIERHLGWLDREVLPHLPAPARRSYFSGNPWNVELLELAASAGLRHPDFVA